MAEAEKTGDSFIEDLQFHPIESSNGVVNMGKIQLQNSVKLISIDEAFESSPEEFSLISYNVLLNAWWMYKNYYQPLNIPREQTTWEYRLKLHVEFAAKSLPDIYCMQECSPESFEEDFAFMKDLGYQSIFQEKGNKWMRCATFYNPDKFSCEGSVSQNRALVSDMIHLQTGKHIYIINCHLPGGSGLELMQYRIRTLVECTKILKNKLKAPKESRIVLCGDFNSANESAMIEILATGVLDKSFLSESGVKVTRKTKRFAHGFSFTDAYLTAFGEVDPPPTFIAPNHIKKMLDENGGLKQCIKEKLQLIFQKFSSDGDVWSPEDARKWVELVNDGHLRGTEWGVVSEAIEKKGHVEYEDYLHSIEALLGGLFWEIDYELHICSEYLEPEEGERMFESRFDYIFHTEKNLQVTGVREVCSESSLELYRAERPLPNETEPSDHLPLGVIFKIIDA